MVQSKHHSLVLHISNSYTAKHFNTHLLGGCDSLPLVDGDGTPCSLTTEGLPAPVEILPGM